MKNIILKLFALALVLMTVPACNMIQEVDSKDLTEGAEKLTVYGFISPQDTVISVEVSMAKAIIRVESLNDQFNYDSFDYIDDARVTISNGSKEVQLVYTEIPGTNEYTSLKYSYQVSTEEFPVVPGQTYTITVSGRGKTVTAQCTVPSEAPEMKAELYTYIENANRCDEFGCITGDTPFYGAATEWTPTDSRYYYFTSYYFNDNDVDDQVPGITSYTYVSKTYDKELYSEDRVKDNIELSIWKEDFDNDGIAGNNKRQAILYLSAVDEAYYYYHQSLERYEQTEGEGPFSEPVPIYTNVEGGFGVFAAYNPTKKVIDLPQFTNNL